MERLLRDGYEGNETSHRGHLSCPQSNSSELENSMDSESQQNMDSQALNQSSPAPSTDPMANDPDPARLIHGLRDTGYDFYTAAADIIDNSIAASATKINIQLQLTTDGRKFAYFGDNGIGMDEAGLFNAMKYGAKIREDLASLGKFGLGLKTASSSVCLKYSLITRNASDSPLRKLTWDLEHVSASNLWQMLDEVHYSIYHQST